MLPVLFYLGSLPVPAYGFWCFWAGIAGIVISRIGAKRTGLPANKVELSVYIVSAACLLGSRFFYTFVEHPDIYLKQPLAFFDLRSGGGSFYGGLIFMSASVVLSSRLFKLPLAELADVLAPAFASGVGLGKLGCFFAGCCMGHPTSLPWGVTFTAPGTMAVPTGVPLHPSQLYEAAAWFALSGALLVFQKHRRIAGEVFLALLVGFCGARSLFELFRGESVYFGPLTSYQWLGIPITLAALAIWVWIRRASPRWADVGARAVPPTLNA
jgi:phosphatidylglycerol---prolipoprotein diacylglyceryl transferase